MMTTMGCFFYWTDASDATQRLNERLSFHQTSYGLAFRKEIPYSGSKVSPPRALILIVILIVAHSICKFILRKVKRRKSVAPGTCDIAINSQVAVCRVGTSYHLTWHVTDHNPSWGTCVSFLAPPYCLLRGAQHLSKWKTCTKGCTG